MKSQTLETIRRDGKAEYKSDLNKLLTLFSVLENGIPLHRVLIKQAGTREGQVLESIILKYFENLPKLTKD